METRVMCMAFSYSGGELTRKQIVHACLVFDMLRARKSKADTRDCAKLKHFMKTNKHLY